MASLSVPKKLLLAVTPGFVIPIIPIMAVVEIAGVNPGSPGSRSRYIWVNYNDLTVLPHWNHGLS